MQKIALLYPVLALTLAGTAFAGDAALGLDRCLSTADDMARLNCYDQLLRNKAAKVEAPPAVPAAVDPVTVIPPSRVADDGHVYYQVDPRGPSGWSRMWDLDRDPAIGYAAITAYRPMYVLPASYESHFNYGVYRTALGDAGQNPNGAYSFKPTEAKFQLSLKVRALKDIFGTNGDLWLAYSQQSLWQVYAKSISSPFRETNYEPEAILTLRTPFGFGPLQGRFVNLGLVHQSNGRSDVVSRSWNRAYVQVGMDSDNFMFYVKPWYRIKEDAKSDDNPDIVEKVGNGEIFGAYKFGKNMLSATVRSNFKLNQDHGSIQIDWTYPIVDRVKFYVQYFNGYGQSLIDYNHSSNRIGVGIMLADWM